MTQASSVIPVVKSSDAESAIFTRAFDPLKDRALLNLPLVDQVAPLSVPLFLFYGLTKGAFLATEAASSLGLYLSKSVTFERFGALTADVALQGLIAGSSLMAGAFIAKPFLLKLNADVFRVVMDGIMLAAGLTMLWNAYSS